MAFTDDDAITQAMIETEKEVAGFAWDQEDTEALDAAGDQTLEDMGDGLEGQHEPDEDDDGEGGEDGEGDEGQEGETGEELEEELEEKPKAEPKPEPQAQKPGRTDIPPGRLREANEARRAAEAERDALKAALEKSNAESKAQLDLVMREIAALKTAPRGKTEPVEPVVESVPDIFEDPQGFAEHLQKGFQSELAKRDQRLETMRVESSMALAHALHKETFEKAFGEINKLDPANSDVRATVQRIWASPNPGEALVAWHKRNEALARVGDDPSAYEERIRSETRAALLKDPEFRKQLLADLRGEAIEPDGQVRTQTRLPRSLARAGGSNVQTSRPGPDAFDNSDQAVADAAWR